LAFPDIVHLPLWIDYGEWTIMPTGCSGVGRTTHGAGVSPSPNAMISDLHQ